MTLHKCTHCGKSYHWSDAFSKFGFNDGEGDIGTPLIAEALENEKHQVKYSRWSPHNTLIYSIKKDDIELMPNEKSAFRIGYDNPRSYLPKNIIKILDEAFPTNKK